MDEVLKQDPKVLDQQLRDEVLKSVCQIKQYFKKILTKNLWAYGSIRRNLDLESFQFPVTRNQRGI